MWGSTGVAPDPLLQFLQRVVPWGQAGQPPSYVNFHGFTPKSDTRTQFRKQGGGPAFESMLEAGDMLLWIAQINRSGDEGFFCLSSRSGFKLDARGRKRASRKRGVSHAVMLRAFVLDLDIKAGGYPNLQAALAGVLPFLDGLGLKVGAIVKTGGGLHVYVFLDQPIAAAVWRPLAAALAAAAVAAKVKLDVVVTKDDDRILRLPTTFNRKQPTPRPCELSYLGTDTPLATVQAALASWIKTTPGVATTSQPRVSVDLSWLPPRPPITTGPDFDRVSAEQEKNRARTSFALLCAACPVVEDSARRQGNGDQEPLWFELAKLCQYIENGRETFHYLSRGDHRYDQSQADHKFDTVQKEGWPACATIAASSPAASAICQTCMFCGKGQSPIHHAIMGGFGRPVAASATTLPPPASVVNGVNGHAVVNPFTAAVQPIVPTWLPAAYLLNHRHQVIPATGGDPVFENAILDVAVQSEAVTGKTHHTSMRITTTRGTPDVDDTNQFDMSTSVLGSSTEFAKEIMKYGLITRNVKKAQDMMLDTWTQIQNVGKATTQRRQGWVEDAQGNILGFSYGGRVYDTNGPGPLGSVDPVYAPRGNLGSWQQAASVFIGKGLTEMEIVIATAFAAPLVRFTSVDGLIVFVRSSQSGEGKTAALETAASVWMSKQGMLTDATMNATLARITKLNNLPMLFDEYIKNNDERAAREAIRMILSVSAGKQPGRLGRNLKEITQLPSRTMMVASSNLSLTELAKNADTNAQAARVLEIEMTNSVKKLGLLQDQVTLYKEAKEKNYGNAGAMYADFLGRQHSFLQQEIAAIVGALQKRTGATDGERFWLAAAATIYVGASIANALGLLKFDLRAMWQYLVDLIKSQRAAMDDRATNSDDPEIQLQRVINFINDNLNNRLITDTMPTAGRGRCTVRPIGDLRPSEFALRYAEVDKKLWISGAKLRKWCDRQLPRIEYRQMYRVLEKHGMCSYNKRGRPLGGGTQYPTGQEAIIEFDLTNPRTQHMME